MSAFHFTKTVYGENNVCIAMKAAAETVATGRPVEHHRATAVNRQMGV